MSKISNKKRKRSSERLTLGERDWERRRMCVSIVGMCDYVCERKDDGG